MRRVGIDVGFEHAASTVLNSMRISIRCIVSAWRLFMSGDFALLMRCIEKYYQLTNRQRDSQVVVAGLASSANN